MHVARPYNSEPNAMIKTVGICAGSGGEMLAGVKADMYLTGEMQQVSHLL